MKIIKRGKAIYEIIKIKMEIIKEQNYRESVSFVEDILLNGKKGYNEKTNDELELDYAELTGDKVKIVE
jgi:hypothetical protein